jgi:hypothetical protein
MKFGIILKGPADKLTERAKKLNPDAPVVVVDNSTYKDEDLFAVFVFKKYRDLADKFNDKRQKENIRPFAIVDVPLGKREVNLKANSVRGRIYEILKEGPSYGYEIYKTYKERYGNISMRLIYYHINKGEKDNLFELAKIEKSDGDFTWGGTSVRKYYKLKSSIDNP